MKLDFSFDRVDTTPELEALRQEVREFLAEEGKGWSAQQRSESWSGFDADFSRKLGERGWIGMTWPTEYGGHGRSAFERYVVLEELLAAGAPVAAHWFADRQTGPSLLKFGSEEQKRYFLPRMARGECFTCIGMSEPNAGSDLAATQTRAEPCEGGYRLNGTKLWTTYAHESHYILVFCRTSGSREDRKGGTSQLLVDLKSPGVTVSPVIDLAGRHHFNEVHFEDVWVPKECLLGKEGNGWEQVTSELAYERSGPERFLSSYRLLVELIRVLGRRPDARSAIAVGRLTAHLATLRRLSKSVAAMLDDGADPQLQAAIVKDLGAIFEQELPELARDLVELEGDQAVTADFRAVLTQLVMSAPSFSLRGGTREILRGIIARGLGLR